MKRSAAWHLGVAPRCVDSLPFRRRALVKRVWMAHRSHCARVGDAARVPHAAPSGGRDWFVGCA
ncbi:hypothetical protein XMIN_142 [Xanthomonas citri pv. mangiferaeindicae LMG 941]|nr:hypothetical protein XMIN_142 [Xanthomonas citri pv. mangiferaeindicae LMG 941]